MSQPTPLILGPEDRSRVTDVLADAFRDYPVLRFVLGGTGPETEAPHRRLIEMFVTARFLRKEPMFGIESDDGLVAAALVSFPDGPPTPPEFDAIRERTWSEVGAEARARYELYGAAWEEPPSTEPHLHLNMIGVRHTHQGRGLARPLLDRVHALARETAGCRGVTLTTEKPANVKLYERVGYRVMRKMRVAPDLESWGMYRPND